TTTCFDIQDQVLHGETTVIPRGESMMGDSGGVLVADSVTTLDATRARGRVVVAGSHCGVYAAFVAEALVCRAGQPVAACASLLDQRAPKPRAFIGARHEGRHSIRDARRGGIAIWALDSVSL